MHFSEEDLRNALRRHDPGPNFAQRVMAAIEIDQAGAKASRPRPRWSPRTLFAGLLSLRLRPVMAGALAVLLLAAGGGLGYLKHQSDERERQRQQAMAKEAERQAILALRITNAKLNRVFQRVRESQANDSKIRRDKL